jgi:hypothetical protein
MPDMPVILGVAAGDQTGRYRFGPSAKVGTEHRPGQIPSSGTHPHRVGDLLGGRLHRTVHENARRIARAGVLQPILTVERPTTEHGRRHAGRSRHARRAAREPS